MQQIEFLGAMGISIDGNFNTHFFCLTGVDITQIKAHGVGVDFQDRSRLGRGGDDRIHIEVGAGPIGQEPPGRMGNDVHVQVFEREEIVGGRMSTR
ncbi:MAG TPA: hypothetical protein PKE20_08845, partial [Promineifilum sp.]|nr:hypothetical protein [Promineifilum sp.]